MCIYVYLYAYILENVYMYMHMSDVYYFDQGTLNEGEGSVQLTSLY
jgi:hypothetical protein